MAQVCPVATAILAYRRRVKKILVVKQERKKRSQRCSMHGALKGSKTIPCD